MNAVERLEQQLNERDEQIEELQSKLYDAEQKAEADHTWTRHREHKEDLSPDLPVPRLELRWIEQESDGDGYSIRCDYSLVYRHLLGQIVFVPLGSTRSTGSLASRISKWDGSFDTPFRDGAHFANEARQLRLPAFVIVGDKVQRFVPCANCGRFEAWHRNGVDCPGYREMEIHDTPAKSA